MNKRLSFAFFSIFFLASLSLSAYDPISHDSNIYILPVTGAGNKEDKSFFYDRMNYEVAYQNYLLLWARRGSNYIVRSSISKSEEEGVFVNTFRFMLARTNKLLAERQLIYNEINNEAKDAVTEIMTDFFMGRWDIDTVIDLVGLQFETELVPEPEIEIEPAPDPRSEPREGNFFFKIIPAGYDFSDDWRDKVMYVKYALLWAPINIFSEEDEINYYNFGASLSFNAQIINFMAVELGMQIVQETTAGNENLDFMLEFPLSLRFVIKPFKRIMIEPFAGITFYSTSILDRVKTNNASYFAGIEFDIKTKNNIFFIEPRFAMDLDDTTFNKTGLERQRTMIQLAVGLKKGFVSKLAKID